MSSDKKLPKLLIYIGGALGLGALGAHMYNTKLKKDSQLNSLEKHILKQELKVLFEAEHLFLEMLLREDSQTICDKEIESIFDLKSVQHALDVYHQSVDFKTPAIRNLTRLWFLNNIKILDGFLGRISTDEVQKSIEKTEKASLKLRKTIKAAGLYDLLAEDSEIQGYIIGSYLEINNAVQNNDPVAKYMFNLIK